MCRQPTTVCQYNCDKLHMARKTTVTADDNVRVHFCTASDQNKNAGSICLTLSLVCDTYALCTSRDCFLMGLSVHGLLFV